MKRYTLTVEGQPVTIHRVETTDDLPAFRAFVRRNLKALAVDSEATGLKMYTPDFRLRLVQFGTPDEAYVIPVARGGQFAEDVRCALRGVKRLVFQNGMFDLQVFDRHLGVSMETLWPKVLDTLILAHLVDPRGQHEGGIGHGLEALTAHYLDADVASNVKGLMAKLAREHKTTKAHIWSTVDLDHPEYNLYAGMDTILAARLTGKLLPLVPDSARPLIGFEHKVAEICSYMERTGFLLDVDYTRGLSARLQEQEQKCIEVAKTFGCENVNSTEQVADVLESMGVRILERTPSGKRRVDKVLLERLVSEGNEFAQAVHDAKKARKWRATWVDGFLRNRDEHDRCHANIQSLRARTARMSITGIPAQTLPSGDWMIRRCFLADDDHAISSIDYQTQELRVLAALSGDTTMIQAFAQDADLHLMTARAAFGDHVQKEDRERKYAKYVNFGRVYGGGPRAVAAQAGISVDVAQRVVAGFDRTYPQVAVFSQGLQVEAARQGFIITPSGRRLPVDPDRAYSALNYLIQSTSRDVTCRGLVRLHEAGFTPYLRLPIHDEVVASLPAEHAERGAKEIAHHMAEQMGPVFIGTDPEVGGRSWGSLYGADY